ncbi:MAG: hypothetical protein Q4F15_01245 [Bacillota bacterium]|nr:hypothetical protein [Bacillota bacterium]
MCLCMYMGTVNIAFMVVGIVIGLVGIGLAGLNYPIYQGLKSRKSKEVSPIIEENQEKLSTILEQAHNLIVNPNI